MNPGTTTPEQVFVRYLTPEPNTGCLLWTGGLRDRRKNYGAFRVGDKKVYAHRFAWELEHGPIPDGLTIDHICRQPLCCLTRHLQLVTQSVNSKLGISRLTHCLRGHLRTPSVIEPRADGHMRCLACRQIEVRMRDGVRDETQAIADAERDWPELFAAASRRIEGIVNKRKHKTVEVLP
jgi:hypothetical protein